MAAESSSSGLASSFTDLMTSLAVIFILLLVAITQNTVMASAARNKKTQNTRENILGLLEKKLGDTGVQVETDPKDPLALLVIVPGELMQFPWQKSNLTPKGQDFLNHFIPTFARVVCREDVKDELNSIVVEGHTDSSKKDPQQGDIFNLDLSQNRSMEVVEYSLKELYGEDGTDSQASYSCFLNLLSASGRGSSELIRKRNGEEDPDKSRRVVFKIRVRSFEQREVPTGEAALNTLSGNSNGIRPGDQ